MVNLSYLYNPEAVKSHFDKNYFVDRKLHFKIIEHGTILPHKDVWVNGNWTWGKGGIVDKHNEFVKSSFVNSGAGSAYTPTEAIQYSPATVIYLGLFFPIWGHVLTDNIRRLWFLKSTEYRNQFKNCPLVYIPWEERPELKHQKNFIRLLKILEVDFYKLHPITQPTRFENIVLPDESFFLDSDGRKFTGEYRETIDRVRNFALKNRTPTSSRKVYYFHGKRQLGEERLAEYFRSKGYEIISPEKLTLDEQLNLLINAESFASTLGSISHNSVFLRDRTEAILIPRTASLVSFTSYQLTLNQVNFINANYVDSTLSLFGNFYGPHCYIISEQLKRFFGDKPDDYAENDLRTFLQYIKESTSEGLLVNPKAKDYYTLILYDFLKQLRRRKDLTEMYGLNLK